MIPDSFRKYGVITPAQVRRTRRLMIGTEGLTNTGKSEFLMSAPGPKIIVPIDPSFDSALDNPNPPTSRSLDDCGFCIIKTSMQGTATQTEYAQEFVNARAKLYELANEPELITLAIDGDSDLWELQVLAEYGRTQQIHPWQYTPLYAVKRAMVKRLWESGKIIIATNKLKNLYEDVLDDDGNPITDDKGKTKQRKVAGEYKRQGFPDQDYLWQLQIRHLYKGPELVDVSKLSPIERLKAAKQKQSKSKPQWGIKIMKCKANPMLEGDELWGEKANFRGLVEYVYPQIDIAEWGFV